MSNHDILNVIQWYLFRLAKGLARPLDSLVEEDEDHCVLLSGKTSQHGEKNLFPPTITRSARWYDIKK